MCKLLHVLHPRLYLLPLFIWSFLHFYINFIIFTQVCVFLLYYAGLQSWAHIRFDAVPTLFSYRCVQCFSCHVESMFRGRYTLFPPTESNVSVHTDSHVNYSQLRIQKSFCCYDILKNPEIWVCSCLFLLMWWTIELLARKSEPLIYLNMSSMPGSNW